MQYVKIYNLHFQKYEKTFSSDIENIKVSQNLNTQEKEHLQNASAVFSANIEGNTLDLNSFSNAKYFEKKFPQKKEEQEIEFLIQAYQFAKKNNVIEKYFLQAHKISSQTILPLSQQGKYRDQKVGVFGKMGLVYMAVEPENVEKEMNILFSDIQHFLGNKSQKSKTETFFFASYIHLRFVHIHPFMDGNGRMARILEKWILAEILGDDFWNLELEKMYKENRDEYYKNINIGVNFYELEYERAWEFLGMGVKVSTY